MGNETRAIQTTMPVGWFHAVVTQRGFDYHTLYIDGTETGLKFPANPKTYKGPNSGNVIMGKLYEEEDGNYVSVEIDELMFFNTVIPEYEIYYLANSAA